MNDRPGPGGARGRWVQDGIPRVPATGSVRFLLTWRANQLAMVTNRGYTLMLWIRKALFIALIVAAGVMAIAACGVQSNRPTSTRPTTAIPRLPTPPTADTIKTMVKKTEQGIEKTVTFQTSGSAQATLDWYKTTLAADGWQSQSGLDRSGYIIRNGCPVYVLHVDATAVISQTTAVTLTLRPKVCS